MSEKVHWNLCLLFIYGQIKIKLFAFVFFVTIKERKKCENLILPKNKFTTTKNKNMIFLIHICTTQIRNKILKLYTCIFLLFHLFKNIFNFSHLILKLRVMLQWNYNIIFKANINYTYVKISLYWPLFIKLDL
jgi:hypothetical protein